MSYYVVIRSIVRTRRRSLNDIRPRPVRRPTGSPLPLSPAVFQILLSLAHDELHGYAIIQDVLRRSRGEIQLGTGTLYTAIKRLTAGGMIEESEARPQADVDDSRRRYYRITASGRQVVQAEALRIERAAEMARDKRLLPRRPKGSRA